MNKKEFSKALELAKTHEYGIAEISLFNGFALADFKPVVCTMNDIAGLIAWQCFTFGGGIDSEALTEIWNNKRRFILV